MFVIKIVIVKNKVTLERAVCSVLSYLDSCKFFAFSIVSLYSLPVNKRNWFI